MRQVEHPYAVERPPLVIHERLATSVRWSRHNDGRTVYDPANRGKTVTHYWRVGDDPSAGAGAPPPADALPRSRYADCSMSGLSRSSAAVPE